MHLELGVRVTRGTFTWVFTVYIYTQTSYLSWFIISVTIFKYSIEVIYAVLCSLIFMIFKHPLYCSKVHRLFNNVIIVLWKEALKIIIYETGKASFRRQSAGTCKRWHMHGKMSKDCLKFGYIKYLGIEFWLWIWNKRSAKEVSTYHMASMVKLEFRRYCIRHYTICWPYWNMVLQRDMISWKSSRVRTKKIQYVGSKLAGLSFKYFIYLYQAIG